MDLISYIAVLISSLLSVVSVLSKVSLVSDVVMIWSWTYIPFIRPPIDPFIRWSIWIDAVNLK